jgi:hypothetical protein
MKIPYLIRLSLLFFFLSVGTSVSSQVGLTDDRLIGYLGVTDPDSLNLRESPANLSIYGYYRMFLYTRNLDGIDPPFGRTFAVGDGYREPMLSMNVVGRPNGRSSFGTELYIFTPYTGTGFEENEFSVNLGINFYGNFRTENGNFGIRAGGIHWYNLSPFTIGVYQVLDRFSVFDRTPWEGVTDTLKYESYYDTGTPNPGDLRWNFQAFQGIILNGNKLPGDLAFDLYWGKTQPNGGLSNAQEDPLATIFNLGTAGNVPTYQGLAGEARIFPNYIAGGRLLKNFGGNNDVSFNTINSTTALDSIGQKRRSYQVHTLAFNAMIDELRIVGELGAGAYKSPTYDQKWGEALMLRFYVPEKYTFLPLDVQVYQISKNFFNPNGEINTGANPEIQAEFDVEVAPGQAAVGGLITQANQLAHNRRGINVNTAYDVGPFRFKAGWGLAKELEILTSDISVIHSVNALAMSRIFIPFPADATVATNWGPNSQYYSFFRGFFERIRTTDLDPATALPTTLKVFQSVDLQGKYKTRIFDRSLYLSYIGSFGSASTAAKVVPVLDEDTYVHSQFHELDVYYNLFPKFILTGYGGWGFVRGGRFSEFLLPFGPDQPRDAVSRGIGVGFDWTVAENAGIYVRHRWIKFDDRSFTADSEIEPFTAQATTIELKMYF